MTIEEKKAAIEAVRSLENHAKSFKQELLLLNNISGTFKNNSLVKQGEEFNEDVYNIVRIRVNYTDSDKQPGFWRRIKNDLTKSNISTDIINTINTISEQAENIFSLHEYHQLNDINAELSKLATQVDPLIASAKAIRVDTESRFPEAVTALREEKREREREEDRQQASRRPD